MRIRTARTAALLAGVALFCSAPAAVAEARAAASPSLQGDSVVSCQSRGTVMFSPGVTFLPKQTNWQYNGHSDNCSGVTPAGSPIVSSSFKVGFTARTSCELGFPGGGVAGTARIEWRTASGETLTSDLDIRVSGRILNSAEIDGTVTGGLFAGEHLHAKFDLPLVKGGVDCVSQLVFGGLKQIDADVSYTVAP